MSEKDHWMIDAGLKPHHPTPQYNLHSFSPHEILFSDIDLDGGFPIGPCKFDFILKFSLSPPISLKIFIRPMRDSSTA